MIYNGCTAALLRSGRHGHEYHITFARTRLSVEIMHSLSLIVPSFQDGQRAAEQTDREARALRLEARRQEIEKVNEEADAESSHSEAHFCERSARSPITVTTERSLSLSPAGRGSCLQDH